MDGSRPMLYFGQIPMSRILLSFALGLLLGTAPASAQLQSQKQIDGRVQTVTGEPLPDAAIVLLKGRVGNEISRSRLGTGGYFSFSSLSAGQYRVVVQAEGFLTAEESVVIPQSSQNTITVSIQVARVAPEEKSPPGDGTVPVQSLAIPREAVQALSRAEKAAAKDDLREAIRHLEEAIRLAPNYFEAYNNLGVCHYRRGERMEAIRMFERALAIHRDALMPHANLGLIYLELSQPDRALPHLKKAAQLNASRTLTHYQLGRAHILLGQFAAAVGPLRRAAEGDPRISHAHFLLAHTFYEIGETSEAVRELRRYLATDPRDEAGLQTLLREWEAELK
jgi:Flp pilus assembly protein TadD